MLINFFCQFISSRPRYQDEFLYREGDLLWWFLSYYFYVLFLLLYIFLIFLLFYFIIWQGKSERSDWFFLGRNLAIWSVSVETVQPVYFSVFDSQQIQNWQPKTTTRKHVKHSLSSNRRRRRRQIFNKRILLFLKIGKTEISISESRVAICDERDRRVPTQNCLLYI